METVKGGFFRLFLIDRMQVSYEKNTAYIEIPGGVDLSATLGCGQAFRWRPAGPGAWEGIAGGRFARIAETVDGIAISPCGEPDFEGFWRHYLDLDRDYGEVAARLGADERLHGVVRACGGMRILNQPVWECLVSFILSSNNNVARISGIVGRLCDRFGCDLGHGRRAFPHAERLAEAGEGGIRACGAGYRAAYVARAAAAALGGFPLGALPGMGYAEAKRTLMRLDGVGEKVADCVLLFSCGYREAFPVDVWVGRTVPQYFPEAGKSPAELRAFARERFGELAGITQQYIFHYERVLKKTME